MAIEQQSLVELACTEIKRLIATGELAPDARVLEVPLAEQLGISRPPLREALRTLAAQGIRTFIPRRGYRVRRLSRRDMEEIYSLRNALERFALDLVLPLLSIDDTVDFTRLDAVMEAMWDAATNGSETAVVDANRNFHLALIELTAHERLLQTYSTLMEQMQLYMSVNIATEAAKSGSLLDGCERHADLLESLKSGDHARIGESFVRHGERRFLNVVEDE
jgi:DNA-binding GntR family transcriptional regulator